MTLHTRNLAVALAALLSVGYGSTPTTAETPSGDAAGRVGHFDPKGKPPSQHTIDILNHQREILPLSDTRDFDENRYDYEQRDDLAFRLEAYAAAHRRNQKISHQIALMNLNLQAIQAGLTSAWEVTLRPVMGTPRPPRWVVVLGRDSREATVAAPQQRPQVEIDDSKASASYANFCRVTGTPEAMIIGFGVNSQSFGVPTSPISDFITLAA